MHELQSSIGAWHRALGWSDKVSVDFLHVEAWRHVLASGAGVPVPPSICSGRRRMEFIVGRHCARRALMAAGCTQSLEVGRDAEGLPAWPPGFVGSISHTALTIVAAVMPAGECRSLGIDIELGCSDGRIESCRGQVGNDDEWKLMASAFPCRPFVALFSAKEALFKALFPLTRKMIGFGAARAIAASQIGIDFELTMDWSPNFIEGTMLRVSCGFINGHVVSGLIVP